MDVIIMFSSSLSPKPRACLTNQAQIALRWLHTDLWTSLFILAALCWRVSRRVLAVPATLVLIFPFFWAWWSCKNLCKRLWSLTWFTCPVLKDSWETSSPWDFIKLKGQSRSVLLAKYGKAGFLHHSQPFALLPIVSWFSFPNLWLAFPDVRFFSWSLLLLLMWQVSLL